MYVHVPQKNCALFVCGGAVNSIMLVLTQLQYGSSFNLQLETLFESILRVISNLWQRKGKISGYFKKTTSIVLQFQRNDSNVISKFLYF